MKKRILSMLLLVAMLATALPLLAFGVLAAEKTAEEPVYTEEDYSDLYYAEGLLFAADWFKLGNPTWSDESLTAYPELDFSGVTITDEATESIGTATGFTKNEALAAAATSFQTAEKAWLAQFVHHSVDPANLYFWSYFANKTTKPDIHPAYTVDGTGYIKLRTDKLTDNTLELRGTANYVSDAFTVQTVIVPDTKIGNSAMIFGNIRTKNTFANGVLTYTDFNSTSGGMLTGSANWPETAPTVDFDGGARDLTISASGFGSCAAGVETDVAYKIATEAGNVLNITGKYSGKFGQSFLLGYTNSTDAKLYAYRMYSTVLSQEAIAQNHFADLAKFFRINIGYYALLDDAAKATVHAAATAYDVTDDAATVKAALEKATRDAAVALLEGDYSENLINAAGRYGLELTAYTALPEIKMPSTTAFLNTLVASGTFDDSLGATVKEAYEAALTLDYTAYWAESSLSASDYNTLYVQNGLAFAVDFFSTNDIWSPGYVADTATDRVELMNEFVWKQAAVSAAFATAGSNNTADNISADGGKLTIGSGAQVQIVNLSQHIGYGYLEKGGASMELVRSFVTTGTSSNTIFLAGTRLEYRYNGTFSTLYNVTPGTNLSGGTLPTSENATIAPLTMNTVNTYLMTVKRPTPTFDASLVTGTTVTFATLATKYIKDGAYKDPNTGVEYTAETEGAVATEVITGTYTANKRTNPHVSVTPAYTLNDDGSLTANTTAYCVATLDRFTPATGHLGFYENGKPVYECDSQAFINTNYDVNSNYLVWTGAYGDIYAVRYYSGILTAEESAKNHFADIAKYFKLNLEGT